MAMKWGCTPLIHPHIEIAITWGYTGTPLFSETGGWTLVLITRQAWGPLHPSYVVGYKNNPNDL